MHRPSQVLRRAWAGLSKPSLEKGIIMSNESKPPEEFSLEDYNRLKIENSELKKRIDKLETENLKLKSRIPFDGGYRID